MTARWPTLSRSIESGAFLYYGWYGDYKACNEGNVHSGTSLPLFTTCALSGCPSSTFPSPAYMTIIDLQPSMISWYKMFREFDRDYPWELKVRKVVWRGALSESVPSKVFESQRWRLCKLATELKNNLFAVGFVEIPEFLTRQL